MFRGTFFFIVLNHGKYEESKEDTQPLSSASAKKKGPGKVKNVELLDVLIYTFYNSEGTATGIHFFEFPTLHSEIDH